MRVQHTLGDLLASRYVRSEIVAHTFAYATGYLCSLLMEYAAVPDEVNAAMTFLAKSGSFILVKLAHHRHDHAQMLRSNLVGTAVSAPQLLLHWGSLKLDLLTTSTRFPLTYAIGGLGTVTRY